MHIHCYYTTLLVNISLATVETSANASVSTEPKEVSMRNKII